MFDLIALAGQSGVLRNIYAPLPMSWHVAFCIAATLVFGYQFVSKKQVRFLYLLLASDLTILTQWFSDKVSITAVAVAEIILIGFLVYDAVGRSHLGKKKGEKNGSDSTGNDYDTQKALSDIERVEKAEREATIEKKPDIIGDAFDDGDVLK